MLRPGTGRGPLLAGKTFRGGGRLALRGRKTQEKTSCILRGGWQDFRQQAEPKWN
jgi:hypothetical protein